MSTPQLDPRANTTDDDIPAGDPNGTLAMVLMCVLIVMLVFVSFAFIRAV